MKILLAVDGSEYSQRMLSYVATHAKALGGDGEYTVLYVVTPLAQRAAAFVDADMSRQFVEDESKSVLDPIRSSLEQRGVKAVYAVKSGQPAAEIASMAQGEGFDMVVMGSHGHNALKSLVLGSVATKVLAACDVPVLLVR